MVGILGDLVEVLGVLLGILGVLFGIFDAFVGLLGVLLGVFGVLVGILGVLLCVSFIGMVYFVAKLAVIDVLIDKLKTLFCLCELFLVMSVEI